jgi:hypothetical protein
LDKQYKSYRDKIKLLLFTELFIGVLIKTTICIFLVGAFLELIKVDYQLEFLLITAFLLGVFFMIQSPLQLLGNKELARKIHKESKDLEYSLGLFTKVNLNRVEKIQIERILPKLPKYFQLKRILNWKLYGVLFVLSGILFYNCLHYFGKQNLSPKNANTLVDQSDSVSAQVPTNQEYEWLNGKLSVTVYPPAYTRRQTYSLLPTSLSIEEGSSLQFIVDGSNVNHFLIWNASDTLGMKNRLNRSSLYRSFSFQHYSQYKDSVVQDSLRSISIIKDQPPTVEIKLPDNRILRQFDLQNDVEVPVQLTDDYGIVAANVVATVSKGEGEAVKFRELKWPLNSLRSATINQNLNLSIKIDTLDLSPGDELYFYLEAFDNREWSAQRAKSDVYFIIIEDTATKKTANYEGVALTSEAEYFKSQRQIIIDTENLIKESKQIAREDFKRRSNLIGADQKILRLRYGVFLGEEFETTGGLGQTGSNLHDQTSVDHRHDAEEHEHHKESEEEHDYHENETEEEHAAYAEHTHERGAQRETNFSNDIYNLPEMEAYVHAHDDSELATFFDANTKRLLKAALANMWDAELFLRTYEPKKALPYEYKALQLIKEVQQASRIYVERIGFEPPPLKPKEKRLTGDLEEINPETSKQKRNAYNLFEADFISLYQCIWRENSGSGATRSAKLKSLGELLAKHIDDNPVGYANVLTLIAAYNKQPSEVALDAIQLKIEKLLPQPILQLQRAEKNMFELNQMFKEIN